MSTHPIAAPSVSTRWIVCAYPGTRSDALVLGEAELDNPVGGLALLPQHRDLRLGVLHGLTHLGG